VKDKKGKQPAIPVWALPRRNPPNPIAQEKEKAINLEPEEEYIEEIPMDAEDVRMEVEEVEDQGEDPITRFPEYVPLHKPHSKVPKDIDESNNGYAHQPYQSYQHQMHYAGMQRPTAQAIPSYPGSASPNLNQQFPFVATLELLDLNRLTNDPIAHTPWWLLINFRQIFLNSMEIWVKIH